MGGAGNAIGNGTQFVNVALNSILMARFERTVQHLGDLHHPGNCLKVAYYSIKLYAKNLFLSISRTVQI
jgi:arginine/lysine/ornithine decarboxylase